ncbi:hypothetical protein DAPPUDRAFT_261708 [Daphnia pulex]|uniref:AMP-binding enzyme C-terminal domain-containing protein n=1 Tax=Daphnia pulex TaxID=6669 RepID=E9HLI5_DAPPU|nr:hypothetical protein DAPPUDRAFT_261708 [Daphnia pulex]|eukprot:EFX67409.1 hypothetical protein DAPPUDRAFT_261708 [Daphnia pulex]
MSLHLRSTLKKSALLANRIGTNGRKAALGQLASANNLQPMPDASKFINHIVTKNKELIKVKGLQVAPAELEDILTSHPAVAEAAVIGIHDEHAGELPRAYVVRKPGMESVSDADIRAFFNSRVSSHKQIKGGIELCATIPKNNTGKILRRELEVQYANDLMNRIYSAVDSTAKKMSQL